MKPTQDQPTIPAEPLKDIHRGAPALLDGGDEAKQVVPTLADRLE
jgi:hypothetical protein